MSYTVIGPVRSRAIRVLWLLEELGVPYEHISASGQSEEVKAYSPLGKVPVLLNGENALTDSSAIITYLADKHGAFTFAAGTLERARQDALFHRILDEVDALLWTAARHSFILPEELRVPEIKESLRWEVARNLTRLGEEIEGTGPYLMGETPTIADILLAHCAGWAMNAQFPVEHAAIQAHMKLMRARPAFERAAAR